MSFDFLFPDVGEGINEGKIVKWRVKVGDKVKQDGVLAEVETDKAVVEIPSPVPGTVEKLHLKEGSIIHVGNPLVTLSGNAPVQKGGEKKGSTSVIGSIPEEATVITQTTPKKPTSAQPSQPSQPVQPVQARLLPAKGASKQQASGLSDGHAMPATKKLATELSVDLSSIKGTGPGGIITREDVIASHKGASAAPGTLSYPAWEDLEGERQAKQRKYDVWGFIETEEIGGIRKTIAKHVAEASMKTAMVTHHDDIDITLLAQRREQEKAAAEKQGAKLTYLAYIVKASTLALKKHPRLNSTLEKGKIIMKKYYSIGIAVDAGDALIVPVIKRAEGKSLIDIAKEIVDLAEKARNKKIDPLDLQGGTFSITNIGSIGGKYFTPILNYPQSAILGIGRMSLEPKVITGTIQIRTILPLSLTYDHRVLDGADAARFLNELKGLLEDPSKIT
ncbi:2-oxo acid dehydrogenase subunit E2 [Candidatus Woesearchaeota archaeon]|nr:2-oxo acid dehydrogenase subunit E2 [Candidatus Woesearchaeota archaeon]HIH38043.1 2-oxo acid dehydrogenase subunit E2 [Candidatus Woesearchaeota archaeon]HIH48562.1 2-oxo acid dehydrogenase subunit E2 [Candidatus Woesearchaeota archaeon]HIJ04257.1 2-oxo acid dehydrogenase subunit E2 [Candidatus Woesearchaeota archaeon]